MKRLMIVCAGLCAMALVVAANPARATGSNQVSYVSNTGTDSPNTCTNPTNDACRSFSYALTQTANYGEIDCVNDGNYGTEFGITQSVTIDCAGGGGDSTVGEITVNGAGIVVRLRNLSIDGEGYGYFGIDAQNMAALYIDNCVITGFNNDRGLNTGPYNGILFEPSAGPSQLFVTDSIISENGFEGAQAGS